MPATEKNKMLAHIYETLEMKVGMRLAEKMSNEQLDEFESFINQNDEAGALKWLETNFPNYKQVVAEELEKLKAEIKQVSPQIIAQAASTIQPGAPVAQPQPVQAYPQGPATSSPAGYQPYQPQQTMPGGFGAPAAAPVQPAQQPTAWQTSAPQQPTAYPASGANDYDYAAQSYGAAPAQPAQYQPMNPISPAPAAQPSYGDPYAAPQPQPTQPMQQSYQPAPFDPNPNPSPSVTNGGFGGSSDFNASANPSPAAFSVPQPQIGAPVDNGYSAAPASHYSAPINDFSSPQPLPMHDSMGQAPMTQSTPLANQPQMSQPAMPPDMQPQQPAEPYSPPPAEPYQPPR